MRQSSVRALWMVLPLLLAACGSESTVLRGDPPDVRRVSFTQEPETHMLALLTGTLGGDANTGCLWIAQPDGGRTPVVLAHDTAVLDVTAQPAVIRDGDTILAAFGDDVELGGGVGQQSAAGCVDLGPVFLGHGLRRPLPGALPTATFSDLRRVCGPADGPALGGRLLVEGVPRLPLLLEVLGPDGSTLARTEVPVVGGERELLVPLDDAFAATPPEWNVVVSEGAQALAQTLLDPRPGPACG